MVLYHWNTAARAAVAVCVWSVAGVSGMSIEACGPRGMALRSPKLMARLWFEIG